MVLWGLYLSVFWAISIYSIIQDAGKSERFLASVENVLTSVVITFCVLGLFYPHIGQSFAPFVLALVPLSAYYEVSNALGDLKSDRIKEQLDEDIPEEMINNIAFLTLGAVLLPGYIAGIILVAKYGSM